MAPSPPRPRCMLATTVVLIIWHAPELVIATRDRCAAVLIVTRFTVLVLVTLPALWDARAAGTAKFRRRTVRRRSFKIQASSTEFAAL